ncbi:putative porin [Prolixibacteraceae bacterium Z1-6]|uniref:Porin n=1 Tax=Draconibacterium aestuarii TaxID=2998507 RepID=A0A9X3F8N6_9BACT|nr:putative porin [Prolixibacteraceae bacterium Z1-6]
MYKARFSFITFLFILLVPLISLAQYDQGLEVGGEMDEDAVEKDTPKKEVVSHTKLWNIDGYGAFQDSTKLDTLHDYTHIFHPVYKKALTATYVGNYGTPAIDNNFFNRNYSTSYFFAQSREAYLLNPGNLEYYNATTPYTRMDYSQSENKSKNNETRFNVVHSQNISPFWNFTFRTNQEKSDGQFTSQQAKNNFVALYTSYNRDAWNIYGGLISNLIQNQENGGLKSDSSIYNGQDAEFWNMRLSKSASKFATSSYFANSEYRVGKYVEAEDETEIFIPVVGFLYSFQYDRNKQEFKEEEDTTNDFFANTYYPEDYTIDSIRFNRVTNVFQLKQYESISKKYTFGKRAYLGHEYNHGSMPGTQLNDSTHIRKDIQYSNVFVGGGIFRETGRFWTWNFDGKFYLAGRNSGQVELNGDISKPFKFWGDSTASINFTGSIENLVPDYFQDKFYSNHFRWDQSLSMEQRMTIGGNIRLPERKLDMGATYSILNNYIYNDTLGIPNQANTQILVLSAYFDKDFNYRNLHFRTRVLWQKASNKEFIHLPDLSTFVSAYYQFTISKVMFTQIGTDVRYNTKYYADAYSPATGLFYLQNDKQYGNYPYIDVYANLRLKRTRVFFKWVNIGTNFLNGEYMTSPHYPMNRSTFRLGVSWAFYD